MLAGNSAVQDYSIHRVNFEPWRLSGVAGSYLLSVALVVVTDPLLSRLFLGDFIIGRVPSDAPLIMSTALFVVISILCAWICARFAPCHALRNMLWFFIVGEVMGIGAITPKWSKGWPQRYWLSWLATWPVSCCASRPVLNPRRRRSPPAVAAHDDKIPPYIVPRHNEQEDHAHQAGKSRVPGVCVHVVVLPGRQRHCEKPCGLPSYFPEQQRQHFQGIA